MNPFKAIKIYLRFKPQIEEIESAVKDAEKNDMKDFWDKIGHVALPIVYAAAGGAFGAVADYAYSAFTGEHVDWARMGSIAAAGAIVALKAYFQNPKGKTS